MIDPDGVEWLTIPEAAQRARVNPPTLYMWRSRGVVRAVKVGRTLHLAWPDVMTAELAWRTRVNKVASTH